MIVPKETLLSAPGSEEPVFARHQPSISGCSERFRLGERSFSRQTHAAQSIASTTSCQIHQQLILENELQRIKLEGNIDTPKFVTGSVIVIMGAEKNDGKFIVEGFCMADLPPQTPRQPLSSDRFVLLAYGLGLNGSRADSMMGLQLLVDMVTGQL